MGTFSKLVGIEDIPNTPFKKRVNQIYDNGACQCFRDCDCYQRKGTLLGTDERYTHPLSTKWFISIDACQASYNALSAKLVV